jgi:O-antigen/teichoic acid export membrane protein
MLIMVIVIIIQFIISMTTTPALIRMAKNEDEEMTMKHSWGVALVQMLLMIVGFLLVSYLGGDKAASDDN